MHLVIKPNIKLIPVVSNFQTEKFGKTLGYKMHPKNKAGNRSCLQKFKHHKGNKRIKIAINIKVFDETLSTTGHCIQIFSIRM